MICFTLQVKCFFVNIQDHQILSQQREEQESHQLPAAAFLEMLTLKHLMGLSTTLPGTAVTSWPQTVTSVPSQS